MAKIAILLCTLFVGVFSIGDLDLPEKTLDCLENFKTYAQDYGHCMRMASGKASADSNYIEMLQKVNLCHSTILSKGDDIIEKCEKLYRNEGDRIEADRIIKDWINWESTKSY